MPTAVQAVCARRSSKDGHFTPHPAGLGSLRIHDSLVSARCLRQGGSDAMGVGALPVADTSKHSRFIVTPLRIRDAVSRSASHCLTFPRRSNDLCAARVWHGCC
jgi:hypothetical protein